jgi:hypothetical protein
VMWAMRGTLRRERAFAARLDVTEDGVREFRGKEEGEGRKKRGPPCVQHRARAYSVSGNVEWARCTYGLG